METKDRLTGVRMNGIKTGYWSPAKKDELIQRLGRYEDLGMSPSEILTAFATGKARKSAGGGWTTGRDPVESGWYIAIVSDIEGEPITVPAFYYADSRSWRLPTPYRDAPESWMSMPDPYRKEEE